MTFEEFWEKNYAKNFGDSEPYYGIASYAFEAGQKNCACVHTDNSAVIGQLREQIENLDAMLKEQYPDLKQCLDNANEREFELEKEIERLNKLIKKMKCCGNCQYCDGDNPCEWHRQNTQCENYFHWELRK